MKSGLFSLLLVVCLTQGCAHRPFPASSPDDAPLSKDHQVSAPGNSPERAIENLTGGKDLDGAGMAAKEGEAPLPVLPKPWGSAETSVRSHDKEVDTGVYGDYEDEGENEKKAGIADPLEPFNRAMYHFNDKLYFWVLKPVAQGYQNVVPEKARVSVSNFFANITFPVRFINCLLQGNFSGASTEFGRFMVNTIWGVGGLLDPASSEDIKLAKQDEDFGQTLGVYGLGQGFFINWPIFGPSSPRDTVGMVGDFFLHPFTYLVPAWDTSAEIKAYEQVNGNSLSIGDYESLKDAAIDPYVAIRDAYVQDRLKRINAGRNKPIPALQK